MPSRENPPLGAARSGHPTIGLLLLLLLISVPTCEAARPESENWHPVAISRDTSISSVQGETEGSSGGSSQIKLKSTQELILLDVDPSRLRGRVITGCRLHLSPASAEILRRVSVSTLSEEWTEGDGRRLRRLPGASSFSWSATGERRWAGRARDITAVTLSEDGTLWSFADASPIDASGFQVVEVNPRIMAARAAGLSTGFVVMDDVGSEYERQGERFSYYQFPNRVVFSREASRDRRPFFTVSLGEEDRVPPAPIESLAFVYSEDSGRERAELIWRGPDDLSGAGLLGFEIRYTDQREFDWDRAMPVARQVVSARSTRQGDHRLDLGEVGRLRGRQIVIGVRPVDGAGNPGPIRTVDVGIAEAVAAGLPWIAGDVPRGSVASGTGLLRVGSTRIAVVDQLDVVDPGTHAMIPTRDADYLVENHLWSARERTISLTGARKEYVGFQLLRWGEDEGTRICTEFGSSAGADVLKVRWYRMGYVEAGGDGPSRMLPDPLFEIRPQADGCIVVPPASSSPQPSALIADLYLQEGISAGSHSGRLILGRQDANEEIEVDLRIWDFSLPDSLSFVPQLNCYRLPGRPGSALEREYYRLAQEHRTCLNRLSYNWQGSPGAGLAPEVAAGQLDFSQWDRNYGPLWDGSAFADLPRGAIPVEAFYLPLNESWPAPVDRYFEGGYWADKAFESTYWELFESAVEQFATHLAAKGWNQTTFEFYLNNKITYKKRRQDWAGSSAPWIFDEPLHTQDFWALRQYGLAFHRGVARSRRTVAEASGPGESALEIPDAFPQLAFRVDVSRPQWQREILDGLVDVNVVGHSWRLYKERILRRREQFGEMLYNYGSANEIGTANSFLATWCIDVWSLGGDGVIPWQTLGRADSLTRSDQHALVYPLGGDAENSPIPSVRLKALRRGQQDVEYLAILASVQGHERATLAREVRAFLGLSTGEGWIEDPGELVDQLSEVDPGDLWALRYRVGETLDKLHPGEDPMRVRSVLRHRDPAAVPAVGQIRETSNSR